MNSQLCGDVTRELLRLLVAVRVCGDADVRSIRIGRCWGFISALRCAGLISLEEQFRLDALAMSALEHGGQVYPGGITGPVMPTSIWLERTSVASAAVKPLAQVPANERQVPAPAPHTGLRLLCLLVKDRSGGSRSLPIHTMRPLPPRVGPVGRWSLASDAAFYLRETRAERPSPEVLARYSRQRQTNALRADSRAV